MAYAARMLAGSSEMDDEAGLALDALADTMIDEIKEVIEEGTRLYQLPIGLGKRACPKLDRWCALRRKTEGIYQTIRSH